MTKKLLLSIVLAISAFGVEIVVDKTLKKSDLMIKKKSTLTRDDSKQVVFDSATGLMWQDDERAKSVEKNWSDAKIYCQSLKHAGYSDWYLPSIRELETLVDTTKYKPAIKDGFNYVASSNYWSSSVYVSRSKYAWNVNFNDGGSDGHNKIFETYVRCARAGQ